jgi:glycerophosphoryl diester phosphodiesterase
MRAMARSTGSGAFLLSLALVAAPAGASAECPERPLVIAHRGASGDAPEHTEAAYELGVLQGADVLEPDLVMSRDGVLVARHETEIGGTTDVERRPQFADRRAEKTLDGRPTTGWWAEDFTWAELSQLRAVERIPKLRPASARFDGMFPLVSFRRFLARVAADNRLRQAEGRPRLGIAPEIKSASALRAIGLDPVPPLLLLLEDASYATRDAPVWIQSFEVGVLRRLRERTAIRLLQLMESEGRPPDAGEGDPSYAELRSPRGLAAVAEWADAIGVPKAWILADGGAALVENAHAAGLEVHVWTLRAENHFLEPRFRRGDDEAAHGDLAGEVRAVLDRCVDAIFSDQPFEAVRARDAWLADHKRRE